MNKLRISATMRVTIGLVFLTVSLLLAALVIGIVPRPRTAIMAGRKNLCESLAVATSVHARDYEFDKIKTVLGCVANRNNDILSAAVRRSSGETIVEVGDHRNYWQVDQANGSSFQQVVVPVVTGNQDVWGSVEVRFRPVEAGGHGWLGMLQRPLVRLFLFIPSASLVLYFVYLRRMLRHMDPSTVVPGRVRTAMDTLAGGLLVVSNDHSIALANEAFAEYLETTPDQLVGNAVDSLPWEQIEDESDCPWSRVIDTQIPQIGVPMRLRIEDELRIFVANCTPITGNDGKVRGVLASFEDVTELELKKTELQASREEADRANAAKSQFLACMSHEIRTPMNAILGFTDVLRRGFDENEEDRENYLSTIHSSGQYLLAIINDILDLSKVESGRLEVEQVECYPHQIIQAVLQALKVKADEKGIALSYEPTDNVPETIISDSIRVRQLVTNLVGNAIKFTSEGEVRVVSRLESIANRPVFVIDVVDSGIGIAPHVLEKVFEPFAQADASTTRRFGGTGLGLAISRRFAEALGGGVTVASEEGKGSIFTVHLAAGSIDNVKMLSAEEARRSRGQLRPQRKAEFRLPPAKILVVDDGIANRKLLELMLTRAGATVETAENGQVGVEMVGQGRYDVVLMDMQMPVMDGYSATMHLRQQGCTLPIIALTGNVMQGDTGKCFNAGCTGFLPKPVDSDKLIETLTEVLGDFIPDVVTIHDHELEGERIAAATVGTDAVINTTQAKSGSTPANSPSPATPASRPSMTSRLQVGNGSGNPVYSALPLDDEEIQEIVREFVGTLQTKVREMNDAWQDEDFTKLAQLGHWLKGTGPTLGFDGFSQPAKDLELAAKACNLEETRQHLDDVEDITNRICITRDSNPRIPCTTV